MKEQPFAHVGMKIYKNDFVPLFQTLEDGTLSPVWLLRFEGALYVNSLIFDVVMAFFSQPIADQKHGTPMWQLMGRGELAAAAARNLAAAYRPVPADVERAIAEQEAR